MLLCSYFSLYFLYFIIFFYILYYIIFFNIFHHVFNRGVMEMRRVPFWGNGGIGGKGSGFSGKGVSGDPKMDFGKKSYFVHGARKGGKVLF